MGPIMWRSAEGKLVHSLDDMLTSVMNETFGRHEA